MAQASHPAWIALKAECDAASEQNAASGYEAWNWATVAMDEALCFHVTNDDRYAKAGAKYFTALIDDAETVGDGKGGDSAVHHDNGYSIRTRGALACVAYDWLKSTSYLPPALRKRAADRMVTWLNWYKDNGHKRDFALANYYTGYFGTIAFFGIAFDDDDPRAKTYSALAKEEFEKRMRPAYASVAGGEWPEGWQYGPLVALIVSAYVDAETRLGNKVELPWLHETLPYFTHSRWPDGVHLYDVGDWGRKPPEMTTRHVFGATFVFDEKERAQAKFLARNVRERESEWFFLQMLADDASGATLSPQGDATSYHAPGTGTVFARTSWSNEAVWFAASSGPQFTADHQHLDKGHFTVVRGTDPLLLDSSGYGSSSTYSHNTLLVDDKREVINYAPNQGAFGTDIKMTRFADDGTFVYALADFTDAYRPADFEWSKKRAVLRAQRHFVFSRRPVAGSSSSARLVVYDSVALSKPTIAVTFAIHPSAVPNMEAAGFVVKSGTSSAHVATLLPRAPKYRVIVEPDPKGDLWHDNNIPFEGFAGRRVEVPSDGGKTERRFLHAATFGSRDIAHPALHAIESKQLDGVLVDDEAYVFVNDVKVGGSYSVPSSVTHHLIAGVAPGVQINPTIAKDGGSCRITLAVTSDGYASKDGIVHFETKGCAVR